MAGTVYLVLAIDTEGPALDAKHPELLSSWNEVDAFLAKIFEAKYRVQVLDSYGGRLVMSWFILTWTGFTTNPVRRDFGYHRIYDHYIEHWNTKLKEFGDGVYWHYHHPPRSGAGNEWCTDWSANQEYYNILNRLVIDRGYFPSVYRAGGTIETNEASNWLEYWIPFDYSNRSGALDWDARDSNGARMGDLCDWRRAPSDWTTYHPSPDDYQKSGNMRRVIVRCLDLLTGAYALRETDIVMAFARAERGHDTILAAFDHDYRERSNLFVERLLKPLERIASQHPAVPWRYANALDAIQSVLGYPRTTGPRFSALYEPDTDVVAITADRQLFGPCPYVACKYMDTCEYAREEVRARSERAWFLPMGDRIRERMIGIASSDVFGNVGLTLYWWDGIRLNMVDSRDRIHGASENR